MGKRRQRNLRAPRARRRSESASWAAQTRRRRRRSTTCRWPRRTCSSAAANGGWGCGCCFDCWILRACWKELRNLPGNMFCGDTASKRVQANGFTLVSVSLLHVAHAYEKALVEKYFYL